MKRYADALLNQNVQAFLRVLTEGESTQHPDAYRWLFGSTRQRPKLFDSFADHPRVRTYETYDGQFIKNGKIDFTTAAGRYQITETTWGDCLKVLGPGDFSPGRQDLAAVYLIDRRKALEDVLAGRFEEAVRKCAPEWASLPGAPYGQPTLSMERARATYERFGGQYQPTASAPAPEPIVQPGPEPADYHAPSGEAPEWTPPPQEKPVAPLIKTFGAPLIRVLAETLVSGFAPLAQEKISKEMRRHTDNPEIADQIAENLVGSAMQLTGVAQPVQAVAAAQQRPEVAQKVQETALEHLTRMAPVLERLAALDEMQHRLVESSRDAAERRAAEARAAGAADQDPYLTTSIVRMMVGVMIGLGVLAIVLAYLKQEVAMVMGTILTLAGVVATGFRDRLNHRYGSSNGSAAKDAVIGELSRRK